MRKINYLDSEISENGIESEHKQILAVRNFPVPENVWAVRGFIDLASYFRRFVKKCMLIACSLIDLLYKNKTYEWAEQARVFILLKEVLSIVPYSQYMIRMRILKYTRMYINSTYIVYKWISGSYNGKRDANIMHPVS